MTHLIQQLQLHSYKGLIGTAGLGITGKVMPLIVDLPPSLLHYAQFVMFTLASVVSVITIIGWVKNTWFKKDTE